MKKIIIVLLALSLTGCSTWERFKNVAEAVGEYRVTPEAVILVSNAFDAAEITATNYLNLKRCTKLNVTPVCRNPTATALIIPAIRSGRVARNNLQQFLKDHPNELAPATIYEKLTSIVDTLKNIYSQYGAV